MAPTTPLSPAVQSEAIERLTNARHEVDAALINLDRLVNLPGLPRRELAILKDQRTKLNATVSTLGGCRQRIEQVQAE